MVRILSFDVGMRNLAFCMMTFSSNEISSCSIEQWDIIDLGPNVRTVEACSKILTQKLNNTFGKTILSNNNTIDHVVIERQPKHRSIIMVAIQMFLCEYFMFLLTNNISASDSLQIGNVKFINAKDKLRINILPPNCSGVHMNESICTNNTYKLSPKQQQRRRYLDNKKNAIIETKYVLEEVIKDYGNLLIFNECFVKKDDLADAFLQGLSFFKQIT